MGQVLHGSATASADCRASRVTSRRSASRPNPIGYVHIDIAEVRTEDGRLALGTWQGVSLFEHRHAPRRREVARHLIGE